MQLSIISTTCQRRSSPRLPLESWQVPNILMRSKTRSYLNGTVPFAFSFSLRRTHPGYDYYYTQGEMSKSDGTVLVNSAYQYNSESSQNVFTITLAGVTFSADLNTYELLQPVSDTQIEQVESWLRSDDGLLARQTSVVSQKFLYNDRPCR